MAWLYGAALSGPGGDGAMHARRILGRPVSQSGRVSVMEKTNSWSMVIEQRSVFPGFSVSPCQQTEVHVCVLWPALGAAPSQQLVSGCASRSLLPAQARVH